MKRMTDMTTRKSKSKRGFTLVELLVTIAIIAILAAIAIPTYNNTVEKARQARDLANIRSVYNSFIIAIMHPDVTINQGYIYYEDDGSLTGIGPTLTEQFVATYGEAGRTGVMAARYKVRPLVSKKFKDAAGLTGSAAGKLGFYFEYPPGENSSNSHHTRIKITFQGPDLSGGLTD